MLAKIMEAEIGEFQEVFKKTGVDVQMQGAINERFYAAYYRANELAEEGLKIEVQDEDDLITIERARVMHAEVRDLRLTTEKSRKLLKDEALHTGQAVDGVARVLKAIMEPLESHLDIMATYAERVRAARLEELMELRRVQLEAVEFDFSAYTLSILTDAQFNDLLVAATADYQVILEERKAEELAQATEAERLRVENIRLAGVAKKAQKEAKGLRMLGSRAQKQRELETARKDSLCDVNKALEYVDAVLQGLGDAPELKSVEVRDVVRGFIQRIKNECEVATFEITRVE